MKDDEAARVVEEVNCVLEDDVVHVVVEEGDREAAYEEEGIDCEEEGQIDLDGLLKLLTK
ncbi:hypothetical protein M1146_04280 [Patescibacteria group bacterium]|nr:hypothetical protein [Patescibacteria group bacterium]